MDVCDIFCQACGFPMKGTEEEQRSYRLRISSRKRLLADANKKISNAKTALFVLAGLVTLYGVIMFFSEDDTASLIGALLIAIIYLGLAAWASKNPFGAILTGMIIYLTLWVLDILVDPSAIYSGIIIRILIIGAFVKGIKSAREAKVLLQQIPAQ